MTTSFATIRALAAPTHGVVRRDVLVRAGVPDSTIDDWLASGWLVRVHRGVYRLHGVADPFLQAVVAACLAVEGRGAASHLTAARLHGLWKREHSRPVHVTVLGRSEAHLRGVAVHQTRHLDDDEVVALGGGVMATTLPRTIVDCAAVLSPGAARELASDALRRGLVDLDALRDARGRRRRVRGAHHLDELLDDELAGRVRSWLEARFVPLVAEAGVPFEVNAPIRDEAGVVVAEGDLVFRAHRLVVEVDGVRFHATPLEKARDDARQNALVGLGWTVLRYSWDDLRRRPQSIVAQVRRQLDRLTAAS